MRRELTLGLIVIVALTVGSIPAGAVSLKDHLDGLFGGSFNVGTGLSTNVIGTGGAGAPLNLGSLVNSARSQIPVPASSFGYTYEFDEQLDIFVRTSDSLGPIFTERALTLGKGKFATAFSYSHVDYDNLYGQSLSHLQRVVPIGKQILSQQGNNIPGIVDDVMQVNLNLGLTFDDFFLFFAYGITDSWDVSVALPLVLVHMRAAGNAQIVDPNGDSSTFGSLNRLQFSPTQCANKHGNSCKFNNGNSSQLSSASSGFSENKFGVGDLYLRSKYWFYKAPRESYFPDVAGSVTMTLPTGGSSDFLGYNDVTGTPLLVLSRSFAFVSPHLNAGYSIRVERDVPQALWAAGADIAVAPWLTVVPDFLAYYDTVNDGISRSDMYQYSMGFKVNPWKQFVVSANFEFPLNTGGLRSNVIYTGQLEYTF